jgi:hypothetical protein
MAAIAFDPLEYTHLLEASGVSREQAEVHAKAMTTMFLHNLDALVTKDYLDSRFNEFETRVEAMMDKRYADMESRVDQRFVGLESRADQRFVGLESRADQRFGRMESSADQRFAELESSADQRFAGLESWVDQRFAGQESWVDRRFAVAESVMNQRFAELDLRLERMDGRFNLVYWMQGITIACVVIPTLHRFLG